MATTERTDGDTHRSAPPRSLRILIADDERDTVLTLVELLREQGHDARGVYKGEEALARMRDFEPDVALLDIAMPGLSGWEVARKIRDTYGDKPLLIAISGIYRQSADQILGKMSGFNYYLSKPYDAGVLLKLLQDA